MIRFCDKEVWTIQEGQWSRREMLSFFVRGHITDIIQLVDENGCHIGIVTYRNLLHAHDCIPVCGKYFVMDGQFWDKAGAYFEEYPEEMVPVMDEDYNILSFCYHDPRWYYVFQMALKAFEETDDIPVPLQVMYPKIQQVCIMDFNEFSYRLYRILEKQQVPVCVVGEKWEWFGIKPFIHYSDYPDYARLYIYSEGTSSHRAESEHMIPGFVDLRLYEGGFWSIVDWALFNSKYVIEEQAKRLTDAGANVCKVVIPQREQLTYMTETEIETVKYQCMLEKYIDDEPMTQEEKALYWKVWGKDNCEYHKALEAVFVAEVALNGLNMTYYNQSFGVPTIWLIGVCIVQGYALKPLQTMPAVLQRMVEDRYNVVSVGTDMRRFDEWRDISQRLCIHENDLVFFVNGSEGFATDLNGTVLDLTEEFNRTDRKTYFAYLPIHVNADGAEMVARAIYEKYVGRKIQKAQLMDGGPITNGKCLQKGELLSQNAKLALKNYLAGITKFRFCNLPKFNQGGGNCDELQSVYPGPPVSGGICCGTGGFFICISGAGGQVLVLLCGPLRDGTAWNRASGQCVN